MNKLAIPSLLLGVVMIAGAFAFMPVQEASTVHTTIQGSQQTLQFDTFDASALALTTGMEIEVTSANDFCLESLIVEFANLDADDDTGYSTIQIDNVVQTTAVGAVMTGVIIDDNASTTRSVDVVELLEAEAGMGRVCSDGGSVDIILTDQFDATDGDLIAGEITNLTAAATVDGDAVIVVFIGAAD